MHRSATMAKLPSWIAYEGFDKWAVDTNGKPCAVVLIRIRRWHPYVWWLLAKAAWKRVVYAR